MDNRRTLTALAATSVLTAVAVLSGGPAMAARDDCRDKAICLWEKYDYEGEHPWFVDGPVPDLRKIASWSNDEVGSVYNRTSQTWCLYQHPHYGGILLKVRPGERISRTTDTPLERRASSLRPCPPKGC